MLRLRAGGIGSGRGASVHLACVEKAMRPEVLSRAFKRPVVAAEVHQLSQQLSVASRRKRL
jgi:hypothetical protein